MQASGLLEVAASCTPRPSGQAPESSPLTHGVAAASRFRPQVLFSSGHPEGSETHTWKARLLPAVTSLFIMVAENTPFLICIPCFYKSPRKSCWSLPAPALYTHHNSSPRSPPEASSHARLVLRTQSPSPGARLIPSPRCSSAPLPFTEASVALPRLSFKISKSHCCCRLVVQLCPTLLGPHGL